MRFRLGVPSLRASSSRVMLLVFCVTVVASVALCLLAWRINVLDRAVAQQRDRDRLEHAADSGARTLLQHLSETGDRLRTALDADPARRAYLLTSLVNEGESAMAALMQAGELSLVPNRKLRYQPETPEPAPPDDTVFAEGEALEFGRRDHAAAARWFRNLASRSQGSIRATALARAARNLVKSGDKEGALQLWSAVAQLGPVLLDGEPAALAAKFARLSLLSRSAQTAEAEALMTDLQSARSSLSRTSYEYFTEELARLGAPKPPPAIWEEAAHELVALWRSGTANGERCNLGA